MSSNCTLRVASKEETTFTMLDYHTRDAGLKVKCVPVHPAGNVDVIHEALDVQRQVGGVGAHELLQFLAFLVQPQHSPRVVPHIELVLALKLLAEVIYHRLIKIMSSEIRVKRRGKNLMDQIETKFKNT